MSRLDLKLSVMYSVFHQKLEPKFSAFGRRFISSLAVVEKPPIFHDRFQQNPTVSNVVHFFDDWNETKKLTFRKTKILHAHFLKTHVLHSHIFAANSFLNSYSQSASMDYALNLFEQIPDPNVVSWNALLSGYNQNFLFKDSCKAFSKMRFSGFAPNQFTYGSVLSAINALQATLCGEQVYALALKDGFFSNGYVRSGMIDLFAKYGCFEDALRIFYEVPCENLVCWNAVISGAVKNEEYTVALDFFIEMCGGILLPNSYTFSSILTACTAVEDHQLGKMVHVWVIKCGAEDVVVGTAIINLYAKCGSVDQAVKQFLLMPIHNVVSRTSIICGFVQEGDCCSALQFFKDMRDMDEEINHYTVTSVLTACAHPNMLNEAIQIHCLILKTGFYCVPVVRASLINMYSKIGASDLSEIVFGETEDLEHIGTWANMISAFAQNNSFKSIILFQSLLQKGLKPDKFCCSSVLSVVDCLNLGRQMHCYVLKAGLDYDIFVNGSLLTMFSKCGSLEESYEVFQQIVEKDIIAWSSMITGFVEHGCADQAIQLFREMLLEKVVPDETTLAALLTTCSALPSLKFGKEIHGRAFRKAVRWKLIAGSLVEMYSSCGELDAGRKVFDMMPFKDQALCSSMVLGYSQGGYMEEALQLFCFMLMADLDIDSFTISSILTSVATLNRPGIGTQLHACTIKFGIESDAFIGSSLLRMYSKCGSINDSCKTFEQIEKPDVVSWTSMITSYAQHGKGEEALQVYELMRNFGIKPDSVTFVGVLFACSHKGLVEKGYYYLNSMAKEYGIEPDFRHYACMVDLLCRAGNLKEAETFINNMPIKPDAMVWETLLAACKVHGDVELGRLVAKKVMTLEPCDAGAYVSLSNIFADMGEWEEVLKIRQIMEGNRVQKEAGWSVV